MPITLDNCNILQTYFDDGILARFTSGNGSTVEGYVRNYSFYRSKSDHVEIGEFPDKPGDSILYAEEIEKVEPADLDRTRASLLEKHSSEEAEKIIAKLSVSF